MLVKKALQFATKAHEGQKRKYTGEDYIVHPIEVMEIVRSVPHTEEMLAAALLHDVVEDCGITEKQIIAEFGEKTAELVMWLTDVSKPADGNRKIRKEIDRQHTAIAPVAAKTIKLADLISNTGSIIQHDKHFAVVYLREKKLLLEVLGEGDSTLFEKAKAFITMENV